MNSNLFMHRFFDDLPAAYCVVEVTRNDEGSPADIVFRYINKAYAELEGTSGKELIGNSFFEVFQKKDKRWLNVFYRTACEGTPQQIREYIPQIGKYLIISLYQLEPGVCGCITENKADYLDPLVGCMNHNGFKMRAEQALWENPEEIFVFWSFDIKRFKFINETLGREAGNRILRELGRYLMSILSEREFLGRVSDDNFVLMTNVDRWETWKNPDAEYRKDIDEILKDANLFTGLEISGGVFVSYPEERDECDINHILDYANIARKNAKKQKGTYVEFFSKDFWEREKRAAEISQHLNQAMEAGEIRPWFQPQYDYRQGKLIGAEVLARWVHPVYGQIFPDEFIHVLEETGQISELDYYIWEAACRCMRKWLDDGKRMPLSINISRRDTLEEGLLEHLTGLLDRYQLDREMLHLEITESAYMEKPEELIDIVQKLKDAGFSVSMDDFGSGYSSLNMLKDVPVETIKLDLRFLTNVEHNAKAGNVISSVVRMAHGMDMSVIAEGVETQQQAEFLKNLGCDWMQGYYFSRPLPQEEFEQNCLLDSVDVIQKSLTGNNMENIQEFLTAGNGTSFVFNRCVGAAAILEYTGSEVKIVLANDQFYRLNGGLKDSVRVDAVEDRSRKFSIEDGIRINETIQHAIAHGDAKCEVFLKPTGLWVELRYCLVSQSNSTTLLFCQMEDVTKAHELQAELGRIKTEMQMNLDLMPGGTFKYEADGTQQFEYISNGVLTLLGYSSLEEFRRKFNNSFIEMIYVEDRARVLREIEEQLSGGDADYCEYRIETADGSLKWVYDRGKLVVDENGKCWCYGIIMDNDETKKLDNELHRQLQDKAESDAMTGLLNQYAVVEHIRREREQGKPGILFMIDVDNFKMINDKCGHLAGNEVLKRIAEVLRDNFRKDDIVGRFGGDEFLAYLPDITDPVWAKSKAESLLETINNIEIAENEFMKISIGMVIEENGTLSMEQLLKKADDAMYQSKSYGRNTFTICEETGQKS